MTEPFIDSGDVSKFRPKVNIEPVSGKDDGLTANIAQLTEGVATLDGDIKTVDPDVNTLDATINTLDAAIKAKTAAITPSSAISSGSIVLWGTAGQRSSTSLDPAPCKAVMLQADSSNSNTLTVFVGVNSATMVIKPTDPPLVISVSDAGLIVVEGAFTAEEFTKATVNYTIFE